MIRKKYAPIVLMIFFLGCAVTEVTKTFKELTPMERATWLMGTYNSEYAAYLDDARRTDLSNDEKVELRKRKLTMRIISPMLRSYAVAVKSGVLDEILEKNVYDKTLHLLLLGGRNEQ